VALLACPSYLYLQQVEPLHHHHDASFLAAGSVVVGILVVVVVGKRQSSMVALLLLLLLVDDDVMEVAGNAWKEEDPWVPRISDNKNVLQSYYGCIEDRSIPGDTENWLVVVDEEEVDHKEGEPCYHHHLALYYCV
jgi:hypothetical protein